MRIPNLIYDFCNGTQMTQIMRMTADLSFYHGDELFMLTQWHTDDADNTDDRRSFIFTMRMNCLC